MARITIDTGSGRKRTGSGSTGSGGQLVRCSACNGTGIDMYGRPHKPCQGTGRIRQ